MAGSSDRELNLLDYVRVVWKRRRLVAAIVVIALATSVGLSSRLPRIYTATSAVITPRDLTGGATTGLAGLLGAAAGVPQVSSMGLTGASPVKDLLIGILKSRNIGQAVIERFDLRKRWQLPYIEDALKELQERKTVVAMSVEGVISVTFEDTDPRFAAEVANYHVTLLDRLVMEYGSGDAGGQRRFIADQLVRAQRNLTAAEDGLRTFQERSQVPALQEQTRGAIEAAARLQAEIIATEVQLQVLRSVATESNPDVTILKQRVGEMRRQLAYLEHGDGKRPPTTREGGDFLVPFARVPGVGLELVRLMREVKVQETLVALLTSQLEQARLAEARDLPNVQMLDRAVAAERPSRPSLVLNLAIAGVASTGVGILLAFVLDFLDRCRAEAR